MRHVTTPFLSRAFLRHLLRTLPRQTNIHHCRIALEDIFLRRDRVKAPSPPTHIINTSDSYGWRSKLEKWSRRKQTTVHKAKNIFRHRRQKIFGANSTASSSTSTSAKINSTSTSIETRTSNCTSISICTNPSTSTSPTSSTITSTAPAPNSRSNSLELKLALALGKPANWTGATSHWKTTGHAGNCLRFVTHINIPVSVKKGRVVFILECFFFNILCLSSRKKRTYVWGCNGLMLVGDGGLRFFWKWNQRLIASWYVFVWFCSISGSKLGRGCLLSGS